MNGIVADGATRLRMTIEMEVRREFANELAMAPVFWERRRIQKKIDQQVKRRMERFESPGSLYFSQRFGILNRRLERP
jgi:hypothetical protein